jgi:hypothetical protein
MQRKSKRHCAARHNGQKSKHGDITEFLNNSMMHWFIQANKKGKEDSTIECHFGQRGFGLQGALSQIYARIHSSSMRQLLLAYVELVSSHVGRSRPSIATST